MLFVKKCKEDPGSTIVHKNEVLQSEGRTEADKQRKAEKRKKRGVAPEEENENSKRVRHSATGLQLTLIAFVAGDEPTSK